MTTTTTMTKIINLMNYANKQIEVFYFSQLTNRFCSCYSEMEVEVKTETDVIIKVIFS